MSRDVQYKDVKRRICGGKLNTLQRLQKKTRSIIESVRLKEQLVIRRSLAPHKQRTSQSNIATWYSRDLNISRINTEHVKKVSTKLL